MGYAVIGDHPGDIKSIVHSNGFIMWRMGEHYIRFFPPDVAEFNDSEGNTRTWPAQAMMQHADPSVTDEDPYVEREKLFSIEPVGFAAVSDY